MTILTKAHKEKITASAVSRARKVPDEAAALARQQVAESIWRANTDHVALQELQALKSMSMWVQSSTSVFIQFAGGPDNRYKEYKWALAVRQPLKAVDVHQGSHQFNLKATDPHQFNLKATDPHLAAFEAAKALGKAADRVADDAKSKVTALLATTNTFEQFRKAWPDGVELLPEEPKKNYAVVPVTLVAELNKMVGVPSGKVAK